MVVVLRPGSRQSDVDHVVGLVREMGLKDHVIVGTDRTVVAAIGDKRNVDKGALEAFDAVEKIVPEVLPHHVDDNDATETESGAEAA